EKEEDQRRRIAAVGSKPDDVEGGDAVGTDAAQFAVEIGLARIERRHGLGDRRVFVGPVQAGAGEQLHRAAVEPRVHAVAVVFDLMQPAVAVRRRRAASAAVLPIPAAPPRPCAPDALRSAPWRVRAGYWPMDAPPQGCRPNQNESPENHPYGSPFGRATGGKPNSTKSCCPSGDNMESAKSFACGLAPLRTASPYSGPAAISFGIWTTEMSGNWRSIRCRPLQ